MFLLLSGHLILYKNSELTGFHPEGMIFLGGGGGGGRGGGGHPSG